MRQQNIRQQNIRQQNIRQQNIRQQLTVSILVITVMCCGNTSLSSAQSAPLTRVTPDSIASIAISVDLTRCHSPSGMETPLLKVATDRGFAKLSRFIEIPSTYRLGRSPNPLHNHPNWICLAAALDVALRAFPRFEGPHSPTEIAQTQPTYRDDCNMRCWFNREDTVIATVNGNEDRWPKPALTHQQQKSLGYQNNSWIFFVTAADLSDHWYWLIVPRVTTTNGNVRVRLISER